MWRMSDCEATTLLGLLRVRMVETCLRHSFVRSDIDFLPIVTWFERTFRSRLSFQRLGYWRIEAFLSTSLLLLWVKSLRRECCLCLGPTLQLSGLDTRHNESPDCLRSSCTPSTLQIEEKGSNLCEKTFQPRSEKMELTQKSTWLDSLSLDKQRKSSKYADHISFKRDDPIFQIAKETLRKAVTEAMEPKGSTPCLKIFASLEDGSYTARYESSSKALSESGTCL